MGVRLGFTMVELAVVLAISAFVMVPIVGIVAGQIRIPIKLAGEMKASQQIQKATLLLTEDALAAQSFATGAAPDYGTFKWNELSGTSPVAINVRYFWDNGMVIRAQDWDGVPGPPQVVIEGVRQYSDLSFAHIPPSWLSNPITKLWIYTEGKVTVSMTATQETGAEFPDTVFTANLVANLRPDPQPPAPLPDRLPPPPPPPNQVDFLVGATPTILTGLFRSGTGTSLRYDDTNYFVVRAAGSPRTVAWEATSEVIDYTTITDISVEFVGRTDQVGVAQQFFVFNPTNPAHPGVGYGTTPDKASTYLAAFTDQKVLFAFDETDVAYINSLSPKVIKIKLVATLSQVFDLSADQLIFKVAGTPAPTFFRDYSVDADPLLEAGSFVSGNFVSLGFDDTDFYVVGESGTVVQWRATSEPIKLTTVSSIQVIFIGRATKGNPVQQIFVFNPASGGDGYRATPDLQSTYAKTNTDTTVTFPLTGADVTYVNSLFPKVARVRVKGTDSTPIWRLEADRLVFRVKP